MTPPIAPDAVLPWLLASALCIATPGPDSLTVLSVGVSRGRRAGMQFAAGVGLGCLTHTAWAALGVAAVLAASEALFTAIKLAGAAYLLVLGVQALRSRARTSVAGAAGEAAASADDASDTRRWWLRGFVSNSLNPKVMLFFVAFIPQFVDARMGSVAAQMLVLGAGFALMTASAYVTLGWASGRVGELLARRPAIATWLDRASGTLFILLALRLALAPRR